MYMKNPFVAASESFKAGNMIMKLVPTFLDRGVSRGQRSGIPMAINLSFLDQSRYFFFEVAPPLSS
jgi:hypothetical protein